MFHTTQPQEAQEYVDKNGGNIYTWKSIGRENWLEKGFSRSDTLVFVVLPDLLQDNIQMPDDLP